MKHFEITKNPNNKPSNPSFQTFPTAVDPVKESFLMSALVEINSPTPIVLALPHVTTLSTPSGNPTSSANFARNYGEIYGTKDLMDMVIYLVGTIVTRRGDVVQKMSLL